MDKGVLALFIPILALSIPLAAVVFAGYQKTIKLRIEEAKAQNALAGADPEGLEQIRQELAEIQERLDFTERMLSQQQKQAKLGKGE